MEYVGNTMCLFTSAVYEQVCKKYIGVKGFGLLTF